MAGFVQIIEFKTSRPEAIQALADEMEPQREAGTARRVTVTADPRPSRLPLHHRRIRLLRVGHGELQPTRDQRVRRQDGQTVRRSPDVPQPGRHHGVGGLRTGADTPEAAFPTDRTDLAAPSVTGRIVEKGLHAVDGRAGSSRARDV